MRSCAASLSPLRARLAIVDGDEQLREGVLLPALRRAGFDAVGLANALQLYRMWAGWDFDLILLDAGLPDDDGVEIARYLRRLSPALGIVMCTGRGRSGDRVRGLRAGVDACLVKPVDVDEVVETLRSVQWRQAMRDAAAGPGGSDWLLGRQGWSLFTPSGARIALNQAERQVMRVLVANQSVPISREILIAKLTGDIDGFDPHRLEMLIYRLRRKCLRESGEALPLQAVRGVGYLFGL